MGKRVLVTGGGGFLGRHIAEGLLEQGHQVRIFDRLKTFSDDRFEFVVGDLTKLSDVENAVRGCDAVMHVASLTETWGKYEQFYAVNVKGTKNIIDACVSSQVKQLIYTSTPSVVIAGDEILNGDETLPYPEKHLDNYCATKAEAERLVIAANGRNGLLTCSLRPHAMFGPRDNHFFPQLFDKARRGQIKYMVGSGQNVVDFTYVGNAVLAHLKALEHLVPGSPVCGQCYFITNGEPVRFWSFLNRVLKEMGFETPTKSIPYGVAYGIAWSMEWAHYLVGRLWNFRPPLTRYVVANMCTNHYFSIEKARRELKYEPETSLDEAVAITVAYYKSVALGASGSSQPVQSADTAASPSHGPSSSSSSSAAAAGGSGSRRPKKMD